MPLSDLMNNMSYSEIEKRLGKNDKDTSKIDIEDKMQIKHEILTNKYNKDFKEN